MQIMEYLRIRENDQNEEHRHIMAKGHWLIESSKSAGSSD